MPNVKLSINKLYLKPLGLFNKFSKQLEGQYLGLPVQNSGVSLPITLIIRDYCYGI